MGCETDSALVHLMSRVVVDEKRHSHNMESGILREDQQDARWSVSCIANVDDVVFRRDLDPLVVKHKVQRWKRVAFSVKNSFDKGWFFFFDFNLTEDFLNKCFVVQLGEVNAVCPCIKDCVDAIFLKIWLGVFFRVVRKCVSGVNASDAYPLVVLGPEEVI